MAVSKRVRFEVLRRDGHTCRYCGGTAPDVTLVVDHVIPVALGGDDKPSNLVCACIDCNAGKSSMPADAPIVDDVSATALLWARAFAVAVDDLEHEASLRQEEFDRFDAAWCSWTYDDGSTVDRPGDWAMSVGRWLDIGVSMDLLVYVMNEVLPSSRIPTHRMWTYFCGAVWKRIRQAQDKAEGYIERGFGG